MIPDPTYRPEDIGQMTDSGNAGDSDESLAGTASESIPEQVAQIPITEVIVRDRFRREMGDLESLVESIGRVGLLQPVLINSRRELIAGARRLAAVVQLEWECVPCRMVESLDDAVNALQAELDENTCREDLKPTEMVALGRQIEALEAARAAQRRSAGLKQNAGKDRCGESTQREERGRTRDRIAAAMGVGGSKYERARAVAEAAEMDPDHFCELPRLMDAKSVNWAYKELQKRRGGGPPRTKSKRGGYGNSVNRYARLLNLLVNFKREASKELNEEDSEKLLRYLVYLRLVVHPQDVIQNGEHKEKKYRFAGFSDLYRVIKLAGLPGVIKTETQVKQELRRNLDEAENEE